MGVAARVGSGQLRRSSGFGHNLVLCRPGHAPAVDETVSHIERTVCLQEVGLAYTSDP